ncbi:MAG: hypothetical protein U7127_03210 [Phormidium sp.]
MRNQLIKYYQGNPLALKMIATRIKDLLQGNVEAFFKQGLSLLTLVNKRLVAEILEKINQIEHNKNIQGIKILKTHKLQKHHRSQQPEELATSTIISALKKRLRKNATA